MQHKEIQEQQHTLPYYTSQQLRNIFRHLDINICNLWIMEVTLNRWFSFCLILKFVALHFLPLVIVRNYYYYKYRFPFPTNRQKPLGIRFPKHVCIDFLKNKYKRKKKWRSQGIIQVWLQHPCSHCCNFPLHTQHLAPDHSTGTRAETQDTLTNEQQDGGTGSRARQ